ncbi:ESX secretion-associated protein EspG [Allosaccharopolyspora coralli]|uniref:ESX secretion-associated protein EspG n=1 Tax=Allosaccharopolyspora coralli TaxID=2665642 RepID=A0A5Q3QB97_9PSEU|nr:ESX secretion-associated protein EspG [Allosaccharopolyspora coralli]QGK68745.1 ESX secretion-associated protein EspG [Allosaccharopolyspora coralli]
MAVRVDAVIEETVTLSCATYDVLHHGECGDDAVKPAAMEGVSPGATYPERVRVIGEALTELRTAGMATVDTPDRELLDTVRLLHDPHRRMYGWYVRRDGDGETSGGFHLAESDDLAVAAFTANGVVVLEPIEWDEMYATVLSLLPDVPPVGSEPLTVPVHPSSVPVDESGWGTQAASGVLGGVPPGAADAQEETAALERVTSAAAPDFVLQLWASECDPHGREVECDSPLTYYASAHGAALTVHTRLGEGREPHVRMLPATRDALYAELDGLTGCAD